MKKEVKVKLCKSDKESWDTVWKWSWFTRELWEHKYWKEEESTLGPLLSLLSELNIKTILDSSCGLGYKSVLYARMGFEVEGSDGSAVAAKYAPQLAKEEEQDIRFFHSQWDELHKKCRRKYDCVVSDYYDEAATREILSASAKSIYSVLKEDGRFIFCGALPKWTKSDLDNLIDEEWKKRKKYEILPTCKKDGVRVTSIEVNEKTSEGILENRIFLIEDHDVMRAEIASVMNPRIKWIYSDYVDVLKDAGFAKVECIEREGQIFNVGIR
jgi:SAM-dependent methyltransferase